MAQGDRQGDPSAAQKFALAFETVVTQIGEDTDTFLEDMYLACTVPSLNHQINISGVAFANDMVRVGISSTSTGLWRMFAGWEGVVDKVLGDEPLAMQNSSNIFLSAAARVLPLEFSLSRNC